MQTKHLLASGAAAFLILSTSLRAQPTPDPKLREEGRRVFAPPAPPPDSGQSTPTGSSAPRGEGWSILLAVFRGDTAASDANALLREIQSKGQLPGAHIENRGLGTVILYGSFADPASDAAKAELARVHEIQVNGSNPYIAAFLIPPAEGGITGSLPEMDLRRARAKYGPTAKYTLEAGYYGRNDASKPTPTELAEFRKAAEEAAVKLRQSGELAFYYHGPSRSSVTVGLFDDTDFDPQTPNWRSPRLAEVRKQHPYHLYNGAAYKLKGRSVEKAGFAPCPLVPIPESDEPTKPGSPSARPEPSARPPMP